MKRDFISILDWTSEEIRNNLDFAVEVLEYSFGSLCHHRMKYFVVFSKSANTAGRCTTLVKRGSAPTKMRRVQSFVDMGGLDLPRSVQHLGELGLNGQFIVIVFTGDQTSRTKRVDLVHFAIGCEGHLKHWLQ